MNHAPVILVGTGVVGRAILKAHTDAGISVTIADQQVDSLRDSVCELALSVQRWQQFEVTSLAPGLDAVTLLRRDQAIENTASGNPIIVESITERLDAKQRFFAEAESLFPRATLCTNTSTLRIADIARPLAEPERLCGMHFFMPVDQRHAVEVVCSSDTSQHTISRCMQHAERIGKDPLCVGDSPGFVVNRLLSPYLNEALLLLARGVSAAQLERVAMAYGMPISPLELIDWIGVRTMFDAGRVYWQSFPHRLNPSPMLAGLIKSKRLGRQCGVGLFDYHAGVRSAELSPATNRLIDAYRLDDRSYTDVEVTQLLSIPMWIEAAIAYRERVVRDPQTFSLAMSGGLGYQHRDSWMGFFDLLGSPQILDAVSRWAPESPCMNAPQELTGLLRRTSPSDAMAQFARDTDPAV